MVFLREINTWKALDWWTVLIYAILVFSGMVSIYAASYDFDGASMFDWTERSGKQLMWIGLSFGLAFVILMLDYRVYETYAYLIYFITILLLIATIFLASDIKGSRSWLELGFVNLQPAEFAKFATSLALARLMDSYNFKLTKPVNFIRAVFLILLPMVLIVLQRETGSALVYGSLAFVLYREGMSGTVLFAGLCAIVFFVLGIKYSAVMWNETPLGEFLVLTLILAVVIFALRIYYRDNRISNNLLFVSVLTAAVFWVLTFFGIRVNYIYPVLGIIGLSVVYLLLVYLQVRVRKLLMIAIFPVVFSGYLFSVDYVFSSVLEPHQQVRIRVSLGMEDDPRGAGYNVNQSVIAIGSGGFSGKGFLNGTQTKLKYVPEQDTDFIFCTIGEEEGFMGALFVVMLFAALILRIVHIAERQRSNFGRVYGYCVASILFFHVAVNIGMVIGLCPVIGIPLPFFSYGGSSLWGFSILLFILLRIDAGRLERF